MDDKLGIAAGRRLLRQFSGKEVEERIAEYSTVYGEVLLGLHREIESLRRQLSQKEDDIRTLQEELRRLDQLQGDLQAQIDQELKPAPGTGRVSPQHPGAEMAAHRKASRHAEWIAIVALVIAISLGVAEWILR